MDAQTGTAVVTAENKTHTTVFTNVRNFTLWGVPWTFLGTEGDDFVQVLWGRLEAQGAGGDDFLLGAERNDMLDGGDGTDAVWGGEGRNTCLNAETGDCNGYPWDAESMRGPEDQDARARLSDVPPSELVSRWLNQQNPLPAD